MGKYRIYISDKEGACARSRVLEADEVREEISKFAERNNGYFREGLEHKFEEFTITVKKEVK